MKAKELSKLDLKALEDKLNEFKAKYSVEYVKTKVGSKSEKAVNLRNLKKDIARVLTLIKLKKIEQAKKPAKKAEKSTEKPVEKKVVKSKGEK